MNEELYRDEVLRHLPPPLENSIYEDYVKASAPDIDMRHDLELYFRNVVYGAEDIDKIFYLSYIDSEVDKATWLNTLFAILYPLLIRITKS